MVINHILPPKKKHSGECSLRYLWKDYIPQIYEKWANARFKYRNRAFWCRGYHVDTVGKNAKKIEEYIRNQLKEDMTAEQLELEIEDPFTVNKR